jgi:peptidyl-prolyl cis-trans isomerase C
MAMALGMAVLAGGVVFAQSDQAAPAAAPSPDTVVAIVNGENITRADVIASAESLPAQYRTQIDQIFPALIDRLVDLRLLVLQARSENLQDDAEVKAEMARLLDETISKTLITRHIKSVVTEEAIKARYDKMVAETPPTQETRASHILLETEDEAKAVIAELEAGADFATLAKAKSKDPSAAQNGGDLGYFTKDRMVPEFAEAAIALEKGSMSKAPTQSEFGWHVIMVVDRRDQALPSFEETRAQLEEAMSNEAATAFLKQLREGAKVELFNPDGTPMAPSPEQPAQQ